ncbi:hypothetical protein HYU19_05005 [Candidatus Woesearchaeota archaeon]|nr:hypothetical protein [Candidatus Woesearchaeota archaeon]
MKKTAGRKRSIGKEAGIVLTILILAIGAYVILGGDAKAFAISNDDKEEPNREAVPTGQTHWHPKLTIMIDGKQVYLPEGIGVEIGRVIDTELSGMDMSPTHTHEDDGTIHIENLNPAAKPETLTLGYFFYVWDKPFSTTCIFEYCTASGTLNMQVNGVENTEFEKYIMHDEDDILIEYVSYKASEGGEQ